MQDLRASFLQRQALREKYRESCEGKKWPFFSDIRKNCKRVWWASFKAEWNFDNQATEFARKLQEGKIPEIANSKEYDGVITAQTVYAQCLREQILICIPMSIPDGKGGNIRYQHCYFDRYCDGEQRRVVEEVEKVLSR